MTGATGVLEPFVDDLVEHGVSVVRACNLLGLSRARRYRHKNPTSRPVRVAGKAQPNALSRSERDLIWAVMCQPRFVDKSCMQVYFTLLDEGTYLASPSTFYRVHRDKTAGQVTDRRNRAVRPPRAIPHLIATGPTHVWSWDITAMATDIRGRYFYAYVMIDIFSRKIIHAAVHHHQREGHAKEFIIARSPRTKARCPVTSTPTTDRP